MIQTESHGAVRKHSIHLDILILKMQYSLLNVEMGTFPETDIAHGNPHVSR